MDHTINASDVQIHVEPAMLDDTETRLDTKSMPLPLYVAYMIELLTKWSDMFHIVLFSSPDKCWLMNLYLPTTAKNRLA